MVENVDGTDDLAKPKADGTEKEREKDSGTDSPGLRVTPPGGDHDNDGGNMDSDPDLRNVEEDEVFDEEYVKGISKLPPGFVRDSQGRIIVRVYQFDLKCKKLQKSYLNITIYFDFSESRMVRSYRRKKWLAITKKRESEDCSKSSV